MSRKPRDRHAGGCETCGGTYLPLADGVCHLCSVRSDEHLVALRAQVCAAAMCFYHWTEPLVDGSKQLVIGLEHEEWRGFVEACAALADAAESWARRAVKQAARRLGGGK